MLILIPDIKSSNTAFSIIRSIRITFVNWHHYFMKESLLAIYEIIKTVVFVLITAFIIRSFLFQPFVVEGNSMEPNMHNNQYLIVDKLSYHLANPKRGDVVVFAAPDVIGADYIKRIIGLPGETVKITGNNIYIDDKVLDEEYLPGDFKTYVVNDQNMTLEKKLGSNEYFVMGDNREHSHDSRNIGAIVKKNIVGRAWLSLYPFNSIGKVFVPNFSN